MLWYSEKNLSSDRFFSVWQFFCQRQGCPVLTGDARHAELAPRIVQIFPAHESVLAGDEGIEQELAGVWLARCCRRQPQGARIQHGMVAGTLELIDTADFPDFFRFPFEYGRIGDAQEGLMIGSFDKSGRYADPRRR